MAIRPVILQETKNMGTNHCIFHRLLSAAPHGVLMLALVLQAPIGAAQEEGGLEVDLAKACKKVAKEHEKLAKWVDKQDLWRLGFIEWSDVIEFNPDHKAARKRLGYEKTVTGQWVRSRDLEVKKIDEIDEDDRIPLEDQYEIKRLKVKDKALKEFEKVMTSAFKADDKAIVEKTAKLIRRYDPYHKGAIAALGMEIGEDGRPVEPERPTEGDGSAEEPVGDNTGENGGGEGSTSRPTGRGAPRTVDLNTIIGDGQPHPWAQRSGLPIKAVETKHHCLLASDMEPSHMEEIAKVAEQSRTRFYQRYMIPNDVEFFSRRMSLLYLADKDEYQKFIDAVVAGELSDGAYLEFLRNRAGGATYPKYFGAYNHSKGEASEKDWAVHYGTHLITGAFNGGLPTWMDEAVAYEQSIGILGSSWTSCINDETTGDRAKKWADPVNWRELVRNMVKLGEDTPLTSIAMFKPNEIDPKIAAKCWSFLTWLLDTKGEMVYTFLGSLRGDEKQQNAVFEAFFKKDMEGMDKEWQRYVKDNY